MTKTQCCCIITVTKQNKPQGASGTRLSRSVSTFPSTSSERCAIPRRDVPVGVPLDLSTPTGMSCIGTYGENCKSDNVSKDRVLLVAFLLLWHEN